MQSEDSKHQLDEVSLLPLQDGLQVQDDLSLMVVAAGLPLLGLPCHQIPRRQDDLSACHHPSAQTCTHTGSRMHV